MGKHRTSSDSSTGGCRILRRGENPAGRAEPDDRGNSVWRWHQGYDQDATSLLLRRLENEELALEPTRRVRTPGADGTPGRRAAASQQQRTGVEPGKRRAKPSEDQRADATELQLAGDHFDGFDPYNNS